MITFGYDIRIFKFEMLWRKTRVFACALSIYRWSIILWLSRVSQKRKISRYQGFSLVHKLTNQHLVRWDFLMKKEFLLQSVFCGIFGLVASRWSREVCSLTIPSASRTSSRQHFLAGDYKISRFWQNKSGLGCTNVCSSVTKQLRARLNNFHKSIDWVAKERGCKIEQIWERRR